MQRLPTPTDIESAAELIRGRVRHTPTIDLEWAPGSTVTLKLELLQHAGSFKPRGAFTSVLGAAVRPDRLVAASGGNHGLAVAHVGATLGIPTSIHVPEICAPIKQQATARLGAQVQVSPGTYADALRASAAEAAEPGVLAVHAYDTFDTVRGQGTLGRELAGDLPDVDTVLVAVGGGGLLGGIAAWFGEDSGVRLVAVEPEACPTLHRALTAGAPVDVTVGGIAADALGASRIGEIGLACCQRAGVESVLVTDDDIDRARRLLWDELRVAAEPAGATALAALLSGAHVPSADERVCVVVCGGNADPSDLVGAP